MLVRDAQPSIERERLRGIRKATFEAGVEAAATPWSSFDHSQPRPRVAFAIVVFAQTHHARWVRAVELCRTVRTYRVVYRIVAWIRT